METDKINLKELIASVTAVIVVEIAVNTLMSTSLLHPMVILGIKRIVQTAIVVLIIFTGDKYIAAIGLAPAMMPHGIKRGLIWSASFGALVAVVFVILLTLKTDPRTLIHSSLPEKRADLILHLIVGGFLGPVAEETLFRGIIYGFFRRWGAAIALIISASLFALIHLVFSGAFIIPFIGGVLFAAAYEREKSLITPIIIHTLGNLAIFTISLCN